MTRGYYDTAPFIDSRDFDRAAVAIFNLSEWISDVEAPLIEAKKIAIDDMNERFSNQIDPLGKPWQKLSTFYAEEKQLAVGFIEPILTRTGDLHSAAIAESAWFIEGDSVMFSTSDLPDYWAYHQQELGRFPQVKSFTTTKTVKKLAKYKGKVGIYPVKEKQEIKFFDGGMPQRAFIGLSAEAQTKIELLIEGWINEGMIRSTKLYERSGGGSTHVGDVYTFKSGKFGAITSIAPGAGGRPQFRISGKFGPMV